MLPEYCCAVIQDGRGRLLLQLRPSTARFAPNQLTCFGGLRKIDEDPLNCLYRELKEELGWAPTDATECCQLWQADRFIAQFYRVAWTGDDVVTEPGHLAIWAPWVALPGLPVSQWHILVLTAVQNHEMRAEIP